MAITSKEFTEIPILDFTDAYSPDLEKRKALAAKLKDFSINIGFFYIANSGVDWTVVEKAFKHAETFFALPLEEKMKLDIHDSDSFRGYTALLGENTDPLNRGDMHEGWDMGPEGRGFKAGSTEANRWPEALKDTSFREDMVAYYAAIENLTKKLFPLFALALDLDEHFFDDKTYESSSIMRLLYYPPQTGEVDDRQLGIGAHTDYEIFTILAQQEGVEALQVQNKAGQWISAPPMPQTFVCNLADQLARWSNDTFVSTRHRAINRTGVPRYSIPFFCGLSYDVLIETLPTCITADRPNKYEPVLAGEYVRKRLEETYSQSKIATGKAGSLAEPET